MLPPVTTETVTGNTSASLTKLGKQASKAIQEGATVPDAEVVPALPVQKTKTVKMTLAELERLGVQDQDDAEQVAEMQPAGMVVMESAQNAEASTVHTPGGSMSRMAGLVVGRM